MPSQPPLHVSLVAIPEASVSTLLGLYDVLNAFPMLKDFVGMPSDTPPFKVEIVGTAAGPMVLAGGTTAQVHRSVGELDRTDIVIVPSLVARDGRWEKGRYPELVGWLRQVYGRGAKLCSACSGVFLLAETGLLDGRDSTIHWVYASHFRSLYPDVPLHPEKTLVVAGEREQFVSCGASMSWHDLALYLIARHTDLTAAQAVAKFFALQWHHDGLGPFMIFEGRRDHGDAAILDAQTWLAKHFSVADTVTEMVSRSGLAERTFKRRFTKATGLAPLPYVHRLRIEEAKRRLERTSDSIDEIGWRVGYEDSAFFRRLFKRLTGVAPGQYRRQFQVPSFARAPAGGPASRPSSSAEKVDPGQAGRQRSPNPQLKIS
ncbi:GlxA family transcriptional regulator [Desertibaculum subflavum]|uniref:GlxA family transcriptional regulator n=1 Tax=Desertibaculum subflavum TaxID=2268458 RepID=UPI0034D33373